MKARHLLYLGLTYSLIACGGTDEEGGTNTSDAELLDAATDGSGDTSPDSDAPDAGMPDTDATDSDGTDTNVDSDSADSEEDVQGGTDTDADDISDALADADSDLSDAVDASTGDIADGANSDATDADATPDVSDTTVTCDPGFENVDGTCVDIDECATETDSCDELVECTNLTGGYECSACPDGYDDIDLVGEECVNLDECALEIDDCDALAGCSDTDGSFACGSCPLGYDDTNSDGTLCENIDECATATDPCDERVTCTDTVGSVQCGACPVGYRDVNGNGTLCESLFETPPDGAPQCYLWGTAHIRSFDGLAYDVQGAGEWRMAFVPGAETLEVQVRQIPLGDNTVASITSEVSVSVGEAIIGITPGSPATVSIDGALITLDFAGVGFDGGSVHLVDSSVVVRTDRDDQVRVTSVADLRLDVEVYPADGDDGLWRGLCGDADGAPVGDILTPEGSSILPPVEIERLYAEFIHAWRVSDLDSLFTYVEDEGPDTWFDATHPSAYVESTDLRDSDRDLYLPGCIDADLGHPFVDEACVLDAYWGDIDEAIESALRVREPELILPLDKPLLFANWQQQGPLANGNWNVSLDFASVLQTINGDPTMFVSPNSYVNVEIQGTIQVATTGDDDLVGFVFGYRSPIADAGDPPTLFDTYLLDWKQGTQAFGGGTSMEGLALSYLDGDFSDAWLPFWVRTDEERWAVLDTSYSAAAGWADNALNTFRLIHREDRVDIIMNDELIFRVAGDFQDGRFGFYNYSQASVRYADFRVRPIEAAEFCGNGALDPNEECDDGNNTSLDGCTSGCAAE
jgi:cysteine-rich repeat protein